MNEFRGERGIIRYDEKVCTHAGNCVKGLPAVFDANKNPWIAPDGADAEAIKAQVARCPSGALSWEALKPKV